MKFGGRIFRWALPGLTLLAPGMGSAAASPDPNWVALANDRPRDVLRALDRDAPTRAERLAWAAAQMSAQPETDGNMRAAEEVFIALAKDHDEIAAEAAYLQARLYQLHFAQPDYPRAAELYRQLAASQPHSHWAQLGLVKLALLELYLLPDGNRPGADRLAPAEALLAQIREPQLQRDLHLQIAHAGIALKQPLARILPHLVAADRIGGIAGTAHEDLLVQTGVLSLRAGLPAQAKGYFERYLREYPTNVRAFTIRLKLAEAEKEIREGRR